MRRLVVRRVEACFGMSASPLGLRIIVIGDTGSGKSTLAQRLAAHIGVPFIELDALYWEPNWTAAEPDVFLDRVSEVTSSPAWVMAGNYIVQQDISWPRAETIVWLDFDLHVLIPRLILRTWRRWRSKELLWGANYENLWTQFRLWDPNRSLFAHVLRTHRDRRRRFSVYQSDPRFLHLRFIRLRSPAEMNQWLEQVLEPSVHGSG